MRLARSQAASPSCSTASRPTIAEAPARPSAIASERHDGQGQPAQQRRRACDSAPRTRLRPRTRLPSRPKRRLRRRPTKLRKTPSKPRTTSRRTLRPKRRTPNRTMRTAEADVATDTATEARSSRSQPRTPLSRPLPPMLPAAVTPTVAVVTIVLPDCITDARQRSRRQSHRPLRAVRRSAAAAAQTPRCACHRGGRQRRDGRSNVHPATPQPQSAAPAENPASTPAPRRIRRPCCRGSRHGDAGKAHADQVPIVRRRSPPNPPRPRKPRRAPDPAVRAPTMPPPQ